MEFLEWVQWNMTLYGYADRFKHIMRSHTVRMDKEGQCRKFANELRSEVKLMIKCLCIQRFPVLIDIASVFDEGVSRKSADAITKRRRTKVYGDTIK
ncbi:hypothetical protein VIGAN_05219400 [Vigna angularis var. angularis]|uniref:Retrotransposon gag domain-containing protein n=1 Tax=Vigna angularis var. angularis TaxID=157739 RepID=A0A0S3S724_PHAAN|nr:hypothetical protein VIGAN_05219400 [Vigna angularis var. angularis]